MGIVIKYKAELRNKLDTKPSRAAAPRTNETGI